MRKTLLLTLLYCFIATVNVKADARTDSLLRVVQVLPHDTTRLVALQQIINLELASDRCIQLSDTLLKEAFRQKNNEYINLASYCHAIYYYNHIELDSVTKWLDFMLPYVRKTGEWNYYFNSKRFQINLYSYQEQFELAIEEAKKMKEEALRRKSKSGLVAAYLCMGNAYVGSQRWETGLKTFEEGLKCFEKDESPTMKFPVLMQLIYVTKELHDNEKLLKYLKELKRVLNGHVKDDVNLKKAYSDIYLYINLYYACYYISKQQYPLAYEHLVQSKKFLNKNVFFSYQTLYYDVHALYYKKTKQYNQAIAYIDTTVQMAKEDIPINYAGQLLKKADICFEAGLCEQALPIYQQVLQIKDSLAIAVSDKQLNQIKGSYDLGNIELEQTKLNNNIRLAGLIVIIIILVMLFMIMFRNTHVRKMLKHSENEIRKATQTVYETNEMKNNFLSNMSYNIRIPLNNVVGFSQLLSVEPDVDDDTRKEYANIIKTSSEELMTLVNDVLDLSRLEARMMKFQIQEYDIVSLCNDIIYMIRMKEDQAGINVRLQTDIDSLTIHTDTARLTQSLLSALTYPKPCEEKREIQFILSYAKEESFFCIRICNSPLVDPAFANQRTIVRNQINQLLWEHFGGSYQIDENAPEGPTVVFYYPIR